jgi:hypothetical protein
MRANRAIGLSAALAIQPFCGFSDGTVVQHNPITEKMYREHSLHKALPLAIIVCGLLAVWVLHKAHHKSKKRTPGDAK